jgi:hypothetical protein
MNDEQLFTCIVGGIYNDILANNYEKVENVTLENISEIMRDNITFKEPKNYSDAVFNELALLSANYLKHRNDITLLDEIKDTLTEFNPEVFEVYYVFARFVMILLYVQDYNKVIEYCKKSADLIEMTDRVKLHEQIDKVKEYLDESETFDIFAYRDFCQKIREEDSLEIRTTFITVFFTLLYHFKWEINWHPLDIIKHYVFAENGNMIGYVVGLLYDKEWVNEFSDNIENFDKLVSN